MSNARFKTGLKYGIGLSVFFTIQHLLITGEYTGYNIVRAIITGVITGLISGFIFGYIVTWFARSRFVAQSTKIETDRDEHIVFESAANHFKGIEGVGGKLYLTNKRLIFKSHKLNIQNHQLAINIADISGIGRFKTLGLVNNGLIVSTIHNNTERFVVEEADAWEKHLVNAGNVIV
jgi:hypothetical protein